MENKKKGLLKMYINTQSIITAASVITALVVLFNYINKICKWINKQELQDEKIKSIQEEQQLLTYGVLACLKGLREQGCNGPVTEAINKIDKHLNAKAHE